jgi:hypothetical protein
MVESLGNLNMICNSEGQEPLTVDYLSAVEPDEDYDPDIEDFWSNPNNFDGITQVEIRQSKNTKRQSYACADMAQKNGYTLEELFQVIASHIEVGKNMDLITKNLDMKIEKLKAKDLPEIIQMSNARIKIPTFCDLQRLPTPDSNDTDPTNCRNRVIILKVTSGRKAQIGHNGKNESSLGLSTIVGLAFYDELSNLIVVDKLDHPIEFWIQRSYDFKLPGFVYTDIANGRINVSETYPFLPLVFFNKTINASIHIEFQVFQRVRGYLVIMQYGETPKLKKGEYNSFQIFCPDYTYPNGSILEGDYAYYDGGNTTVLRFNRDMNNGLI